MSTTRMSRRLRRLLLLLPCLLVAVGTASNTEAQPVRIGVQAGPSFAFLSDSATPFSTGTPRTNANLRLTLQAGIHLVVPLTEHLALQPELRYLQKGGHFSQPLTERYTVERYRFSYLQGAVLLRPSVPIPGPLSLHFVAGLTVDRALGGTAQRNVHSAENNFATRVALQDPGYLRRWDLGGILGAGLSYPIGTESRVALTLRYNPGFRSAFVQSEPSASREAGDTFPLSSSLPSLRHDVITAGLSYTLPVASLF